MRQFLGESDELGQGTSVLAMPSRYSWLETDVAELTNRTLGCLLPPTTLKEPKGFKNTRPEPRSESVPRFARNQGQKQGSTSKGLNR